VSVADDSVEFLKGTLDLMILKTLSWAPAHGYGIARWIEQCTDDVLQVEEGSLYPALYKLEEQGFVLADWGITEHNRRAKFYRLTAAGKRHLKASHNNWARFARAVTQVLEISPATNPA
jgi:PadR family transcriptional regulator PadR